VFFLLLLQIEAIDVSIARKQNINKRVFLFFIVFIGEKLPFFSGIHKRTILPFGITRIELINRT
jgi:hypothetical protein